MDSTRICYLITFGTFAAVAGAASTLLALLDTLDTSPPEGRPRVPLRLLLGIVIGQALFVCVVTGVLLASPSPHVS